MQQFGHIRSPPEETFPVISPEVRTICFAVKPSHQNIVTRQIVYSSAGI